jgi:hypothetical protein
MNHLDLLDMELNGKPMFRFNRLSDKLYLDVNWESDIIPGTFIVVEGYRSMDPTDFPKIWREIWLQRYATALIKKQWGTNMKKFGNIQLPGGVTLDGQSLYNEAIQELDAIKLEIQNQAPLEFFLG